MPFAKKCLMCSKWNWKSFVFVLTFPPHRNMTSPPSFKVRTCLRSKSLCREELAVRCVTMCKMRSLRALVKQRLSSAVEEIFGLLESSLTEYKEEIDHRRRLLQAVTQTDAAGVLRTVLSLLCSCHHSSLACLCFCPRLSLNTK